MVLHEIETAECPASEITPESKQLVEIFMTAENAGVSLYGPDLSRWPARLVDAAAVIGIERSREKWARQEAAYAD